MQLASVPKLLTCSALCANTIGGFRSQPERCNNATGTRESAL